MAEQLRIEMDTYRLPSPRLGRPVLVFEVTSKVTDDLFLLVPRPRIVAILNGILGRAQQKTADFDFDLYGYYFMSNHLHLLIGVEELVDKSLVLEWVNREIARRINKYHDRTGQLLTPNHAIQITSEAHALERLRYVMGQATAQLKTRHPADDVFACANPALLRGEPLTGVFVHGNGVEEEVTVRLDRLPGLGDLTPRSHRALMWQLADGIAGEHRPRRKKAGLPVPDPEAVRQVDPWTRPKVRDRSPAPVVHGTPEQQAEWRALHATLREAYTEAHIAYWKWLADPRSPLIPFPPGTIPPSHARKAMRALAESG
ncbi:MAG: transposase [Myxococcales bacterium]|nr:transposase [Myxococcales bacterium]